MAEVAKGYTMVPGGPFPPTRESVRAADLAALNAYDPSLLYVGMIGLVADQPTKIYKCTSTSPLTWADFPSGGAGGDYLVVANIAARDALLTASLKVGQQVATQDNGKVYRLLALPSTWQEQPVVPARFVSPGPRTLSGLTPAVDTTAILAGDRVLLVNQAAPATNGVYIAAAGAWARAPDFALAGAFKLGHMISVQEGAALKATLWQFTQTAAIILETTSLTYQPIGSLASNTPVTVGSTGATGGVSTLGARIDHKHQVDTAMSPIWTQPHQWNSSHLHGGTIGHAASSPSNTIPLQTITFSSTASLFRVTPSVGASISVISGGGSPQQGARIYIMNISPTNVLEFVGPGAPGGTNLATSLLVAPGQVSIWIYDSIRSLWSGVVFAPAAPLYKTYPAGNWGVGNVTADFSLNTVVTTSGQLENFIRIDPTGGPIIVSSTTVLGSPGHEVTFKNVSPSLNPIYLNVQGLGDGSVNSDSLASVGQVGYVMRHPYEAVTLMAVQNGWHLKSIYREAGDPVCSDLTRPSGASMPPRGFTVFNSDDNAPNWSDGAQWRDAYGLVT